MKANTPLILMFILCCFLHINIHAQCDGTSDVIQNTSNTNVSWGAGGDTYGNTFTPTCSGKIEGISFWTREASGSIGGISMTVELYRNPLSNNPVLLASQTQDIPFDNANRERYFVFDEEPDVVSGTSYGFRVTRNDTQFSVKILLNNSNPYSGGRMFLNDFDATGTTQNWDLRFQIHYFDEVAPNANCRNITRTLGTNNTVSISPSNINNGSTDADSGIASFSISQSNFDCGDIGENTVTLTVVDNNGNPSSCQAIVTIVDENPPILVCPGDMTVFTNPGVPVTVDYDAIEYVDCSVETPSNFSLVGVWDGKSYFVSNYQEIPEFAFAAAEALGGHLATVLDQDHNDFLRSAVSTSIPLLIGYNDLSQEGSFVWHSGTSSTYTNWTPGEPNNSNNEDYTIIGSDGQWNDVRNTGGARRFVIELSQSAITQTAGLPSGSTFPLGETTNTFVASDALGNVGACSFTVTVEENPYETIVDLANGKLTITDIENDSDDQITMSSDGTTLTISNLVLPTVSGGPTLANATTVTVAQSSITNGIEFNANNGNDAITFSNNLSLTGVNNGITLNDISDYSQSGTINIEGDFIVAGNSGGTIALNSINARNLSITGVDVINDAGGTEMNISGTTTLQTIQNINLNSGITNNNQFGGIVTIEASSVIFSATGDLTFGAVTTTGADNTITNFLITTEGNMNLSGSIITAGNSNLTLRGGGAIINQTAAGTITTNRLGLEGNPDGSSVALLEANNDISALQANNEGNPVLAFAFKDINTVELLGITVEELFITANTFTFSDATEITKNGTGNSNINGGIDVTATLNTNPAIINHNAGNILFNDNPGMFNFSGAFQYNGAINTLTRFNGNALIDAPSITQTFGELEFFGEFFVASTSIINTQDNARFAAILSGSGTFTGGPLNSDAGSIINPGSTDATGQLTTANLEIDGGTFSPTINSDSDFDSVNVIGTVTLTDADFEPTGDFSIDTGTESIILISNDDVDPITGVFNGLSEGAQVTLPGTGDIFIISYTGGDGNDITLTRDSQAPIITCPSDVTIDCADEAELLVIGASADTPIDIPDDNNIGITSLANVTGIDSSFEVTEITVQAAINHTWTGDLSMDLISPSGETVVLFADFLNENSDLNASFPITFSDNATTAANDIGNTIFATEAACEDDNICEYTATEGVNAFSNLINEINANGNSFNGDWTLSVRDQVIGDLGNLVSWQINIKAIDPNATVDTIDTNPSATGTATATDNCNTPDCDVTITYEDVIIDGCGISEVITRTWTATDISGNMSTCVQTITVTDTRAPELTSCPEDIVIELAQGDSDAIINYNLPEATDICGDVTITQTEGLASGEVFPEGITTNTFSITDECGNEAICSFDVIVAIPETRVALDAGTLIITDINGGTSDDNITFSNDGTTLTISNLVSYVSVSGGPILTDATTVTVPLANITNGIEFNGGDGFNSITFDNDLTLTGVDNDITLNDLKDYTQNGSINIEGDFTISNGFGFDLLLGELTANNLTIDGVDKILDQELALTIAGVTQLQALDGIDINDGQSRHSFAGEVNLTAGQVAFTAGANTTFGSVTVPDTGDGIIHELTVSPGNIIFNGNVSIAGSNANLFVCGNSNISQTSGIIQAPFLILRGNGTNTTATLNNDNEVQALATANPFDANAVDLVSLSFTNSTNMFLEVIHVNEFDLTAPEFDLEPNFTVITKEGTGESNFNANIDVNSGNGTVIVNHNAGTINFNGESNDFESQFTYNGLAETVTNIYSLTTDFPFGGPNRSFTFGTLNGTGAIDIGDIQLNLLDGANFSGASTLLTGFPFFIGESTVIENGATITPSAGPVGFGLSYNVADLSMVSGAIFAPLVEGTTSDEYDRLNVNGTVTLTNAVLAPIGGYTIQAGDEIIIIDNDEDDPVNGIFENLPEGSGISFGDFAGMISYVGGDGNDVVLIPDTIDPIAVCQNINLTVGVGGITVTGDQLNDGSSDNGPISEFLINGQPSIDFSVSDVGDNQLTLTVVDATGNTAECTATITLVSNVNVTLPILISEFQPLPTESNNGANQTIEIKGAAGESFVGTFVIIDGSESRSDRGRVVDATDISGTFNVDGILTASVQNFTNPSHTAVLTNTFSGTVDVTDIDTDNDGIIDNLSAFGTIFDAVGVQDGGACCPINISYGNEFGGIDLASIGSPPAAIFRDASTGDFYQLNTSGTIYDNTGSVVDVSVFDTTPTVDATFGIINPSTISQVTVSLKVYLQGASLNPNSGEENLMRDDLRVAGLLPVMSPYGDTSAGSETFFDTGNDNINIVDWVWVELRDATDNTIIVEGRSAVLRRNGEIVSLNNNSSLSFNVPPANYYVVIKHRNHLGIMSASPITLSSTTTVVDFTDATNPITFGTNAQTTIGMPTGVLGMWAGDTDGDGEVSFANDGNSLLFEVLFDPDNTSFSSLFTGADDYYRGDADLSGNASFQDDLNHLLFNVLFHPSNSSFSSLFTFTEQLPTGGTTRVVDTELLERRAYINQKLRELQELIDNNN